MSEQNVTLQDIIIDEEFKRLLPPLDGKTFLSLEQSILDYGCMNPLVLWNNILIDGYNRYDILTKHDLPFNTTNLEFDSRDEVLIWIISTQVSRRNLTTMQLTYFRGLHYNTEKKLRGGDKRSKEISKYQNDTLNDNTAIRLSEQYKVAPITIKRDGQIASAISAIGLSSPDAKRDILSGETRISRRQLREMTDSSDDNITKLASEIAAGTFKDKYKPEKPQEPKLTESNNNNNGESKSNQPLPIELIVRANTFIDIISRLPVNPNSDELKATIRKHINQLEEIYRLA